MRLVCTLIGLAAVASLHAQAFPYMEARELLSGGRVIGHGVAAYGTLADGTRWFYSHAKTGQTGVSDTTIRSWSKADGTPIRAIYTAHQGSRMTTTTVTVQDDEATMVEEVRNGGSAPATRTVKVKAKPSTVLQLSQFNPKDIRMSGQAQVELTILDPVALSSMQATLELVAAGTRRINGRPVGEENRYLLHTANGDSQIRVDGYGLLIGSLNSQGFLMRPVEMEAEDQAELLQVMREMRGQ